MNEPGGLQVSTYDWENLKAAMRLFFLVVLLIVIGVFASQTFDNVDPRELAEQYRERFWFFSFAPSFILVPIAAIFNIHTLRYMIAPLGAFVFVMIAGSYFVKDIYALPTFKDAFNYVMASMFAIDYPRLIIDKGVKKLDKSTNLIDKVGGPGFVIVEPGNAATFRNLYRPTGVSVSSTYFLAPFETIAQAVNLDDQQGDKDELETVTRDGLRVKLRDIHFRYRIQQEQRNGQPVRRTLESPYPFSPQALRNMAFNLSVQKNGLDKWGTAVERAVTGAITDFIASRTVDYLTAPRTGGKSPRIELKDELLYSGVRRALENLGAELLWIDVGHIEIIEEAVDDQRANLWAVDWVGDAAISRAYGEAKRQAYQELGRAEAQAELILSIADALDSANLTDRTAENVRKIFLARTAQVLDAISASKTEHEKK